METNKLLGTKEQDPEWIKELVEGYLQKDINTLSDYQKKMLRDQYLDNLRDGLKPKDAIEKAFSLVSCFS
jgi:SPX domain protein involved in polyphosphate accumulation